MIVRLISFLLIYPLSINSALSRSINHQLLSNELELILNQEKQYDLVKDLFLQNSFQKFEKHYLDFKKNYKDAKWSIKTISSNPNETLLDIKITSKREISDRIYNLSSKQTVQVKTLRNKIKSFKVFKEESILNSQNSPLIVQVISPDEVLTGERYEMNLIVEKPLDNSLIASGIIIIKNKDNINISNNKFDIKPNQSGGLFKYIQAPLEPGFQTISAIISHPEGIYLITKKIKVGL